MLSGVGVDLVSIPRIEKIYTRFGERFLRRIFSRRELDALSDRKIFMASLAARFAAKEAALKAIGCGIGPASLKEVEVITAPGEQPRIELRGEALRQAAIKNITSIVVSMSHEPPFACAVAAACRLNGDN